MANCLGYMQMLLNTLKKSFYKEICTGIIHWLKEEMR